MARVGLVVHDSSLRHICGSTSHPEHPRRVETILAHLEATGLGSRLEHHEPEPADRGLIELVHSPGLVDLIERLDEQGGGRIDLDTAMGPGSLEATLRASKGAVDAVDRVGRGEWDGAFVCMRPPGHHATSTAPMGFCLTNHIAVAARWALTNTDAKRVVVIDWDAHHGNGTQDIFWGDPDVLYVSLHQYPWYPGSGDATERGEGDGFGYTVNVPLPAGAAEDTYERAMDEIVEPAVVRFAPDLVLVSAGFDAHQHDPLCMMRLTAGAFYRFARRVARWGRGPVCILEGGYDLDALAWSSGAVVSALVGSDEQVGVPKAELSAVPGAPDAVRWVERAASFQRSADVQTEPRSDA